MNCIICGAPTRVIETRDAMRTRVCDGTPSHRRRTVEVDTRVLKSIQGNASNIVERIRNGARRQSKAEQRRQEVVRLRSEGVMVKVIAHRLDIGERQAYYILNEEAKRNGKSNLPDAVGAPHGQLPRNRQRMLGVDGGALLDRGPLPANESPRRRQA